MSGDNTGNVSNSPQPEAGQINIMEVTTNLPIVYANGVFVQLGNNDGHMTFVLDTMEDPQNVRRIKQVRVVATPLLMKALHQQLTSTLDQYEAIMGPVDAALRGVTTQQEGN
jgi:Protein of unknown function (DUF3467)